MGLSVAEFAALTPFQFELKCKGYVRARDEEESNFRRLAYINFAMSADKKTAAKYTIDDIWPTRSGAVKQKEQKGLTKNKVNKMLQGWIKSKIENNDGRNN